MPNKIKILLAEDNSNDVKILCHYLTAGGIDFTLTEVQTPEDFTSVLISFQPDIVLSDYSMPQFNGMEALKIKKQVYPDIPFIIVTGSLNEETAVECIKAGADDYVVKEHISAIVPAVLSALKKYELEREKIRLQNEIAEREEKYRSIFSVSADAIIIVEKATGKIIDANEAACRLYKYSLEEFLEFKYNRLLNIPIINSPSFNNDSGLVNYHLTKEGSLIPVEMSFSTYTRNNNSYLILNVRDISEKKRFNEKLRKNREHQELLYNLSRKEFNLENELVEYALGEITRITSSKMGCLHYLNMKPDESGYNKISCAAFNINKTETCSMYSDTDSALWKECLETKKPFILNNPKTDKKNCNPDIISNVKSSLSIPILEDNNVTGIICLCNKETCFNDDDLLQLSLFANELWKIIQKRRHIEKIKQFSTVIEQSPLSIVIANKDGIIEYVNPKFCEITGFSFEEAVGKTGVMLDSNIRSIYYDTPIRETILSGNEWKNILHNKRKNGELFWGYVLIFPVKNKLGEITDYIGIMEDITKRVETEKELENYRNQLEQMVTDRTIKLAEVNKQLADNLEKEKAIEETVKDALSKEKELNELKSKFISTISHEFRTPLATILSSIELMELFGQKWNSEKQSKHFLRIKESIKNLTLLLDEILTISRVETGKIKLNPESKDLNEFCRKIISDTKDLSGRKHNIIYKFTIEKDEFNIDEKLLKYILNNLLSNSVKYTPEGGKIELTVSLVKNDICFEVKDNGIGIPKKDQQHLFEPFFRADNCQNISGSGLGLSIVKNSVDLYNGNITFESRENKGTVFRVYIPVNVIMGVN